MISLCKPERSVSSSPWLSRFSLPTDSELVLPGQGQYLVMPPRLRCRQLRHPFLPPTTTITTTLHIRSYSTAISSMPVHPPSPRPGNWKSAAPAPPAGTTTFSAQSSLPTLPVLPLAPTLDRLRHSLVPIAHSPAEFAETERKIHAFANGIGPELQRRLEAHAQGRPHWLEEWWDDGAYLSYRDSVGDHFSPQEYFAQIVTGHDQRVVLLCVVLSLIVAHKPILTPPHRWLRRSAECEGSTRSPCRAVPCCVSHARCDALSPRLEAR
ncbi:hypothetical protein BJY52DRAFT_1249025 [Lactarius psammicola]|nr:hypothetical protein BJY52DRAFT_1249025 [Lactarius psammicola]